MKDAVVAGAVSGVTARIITTPLDVIKIRFQLQLEPIRLSVHHVSKYRGITQAIYKIIAEEGIQALWKGTIPGLLMYAVYGSVQFSCFDRAAIVLKDQMGIDNNIVRDFVSGFIGGSIASFVVQPLDVIRTRLAGQGEPKHYKNIRSAISLMYKERGLRTFYRGLTPAILLIGPQAGLHFGFYSLYNHLWRRYKSSNKEKKDEGLLHGNAGMQSIVCGALAGVSSKTICLPLDVVKKRLEVRGFEKARASFGRVGQYKGMSDIFVKIWREEKVFGFYKGALPSLIKTGVSTAVLFTVYDCVLVSLQ
uniref:Mitochondrial thiamine pyrophosphate carrier n=1 Tax=Amphimedon queenslandica TaxID=400682 RepID=A0A1X7VWC9_AMPQE